MEITTSFTVLVWILSVTLFIFLALSIVALVYMIKILDDLKKISTKAERLAESAEAAAEMLRKTAGPMAIGRFITNIADTVMKHKSNKRSDEE